MELTHKGIKADIEIQFLGFSNVTTLVQTRNSQKQFVFHYPELDDIDFRDACMDDESLLDLKRDSDVYEEMLEWIEKDVVKGFYIDMLNKDADIHDYKITCNSSIKLWHKNKPVATGESDIEDYIAVINLNRE